MAPEPQIVYKTVTINEELIDKFLDRPFGGYYSQCDNTITMLNYTISGNLSTQQQDTVKAVISIIEQERDSILEHEKQHWRNHRAIPNFHTACGLNYYQEIYLNCLDEVSALTAGTLFKPEYQQIGINQRSVLCVMSESTEYFCKQFFDQYIQDFTQRAAHRHWMDVEVFLLPTTSHQRLQDLQKTFQNEPEKLFNEEFYLLMTRLFEFSGYNVWHDKLKPKNQEFMDMLNDNLFMLKAKSMAETSKMIDTLISQGPRKTH
ncbi:MAG: hypothetical protein J5608_01675 [Alphaproteobacteria bacterium]|nr:hypothetical protein [Alphaproteobacteria bacterium]